MAFLSLPKITLLLIQLVFILHSARGFVPGGNRPFLSHTTTIRSAQKSTPDESADTELDRILVGWADLVNGKAFDGSKLSRLATSTEDVIGVVGHFPLIAESLRTAVTGQFSPSGYAFCAATTLITSLAHAK